jgi:hypothetical protein
MGSIEVGGDSSVKWKIEAGRVRKVPPDPGNGVPPVSTPNGPNGHHQKGIDETEPGQYFTISIEVPLLVTDKMNLASGLQAAATAVATGAAGSGFRVSFTLPIEDGNENQVQVTWNSRP